MKIKTKTTDLLAHLYFILSIGYAMFWGFVMVKDFAPYLSPSVLLEIKVMLSLIFGVAIGSEIWILIYSKEMKKGRKKCFT